jgi:carboxylesterase
MAEHPGLDLNPFFFAGGPVGCLMIHGFTSAPPDLRPMGEYLAGQGLTVLGVRLPGHGTTPAELAQTRWPDWAGEALRGLGELQARCRQVFVAGFSMGGVLALYLAERYALAGVIAMAAALRVSNRLLRLAPLASRFVREIRKAPLEKSDWVDRQAASTHWSYWVYPLPAVVELLKLQAETRRGLARVTAPLLILQGERDAAVPPASARWLYEQVGSTDKELVYYARSGHCLTLDAEREMVWRKAWDFIDSRSKLSSQ